MIKRIISLVLVIALTISLFACGNNTPEDTTITVVDQAGRTVTLDKPAEKIVSCYYISSYACLALGVGNKLVGIEKKANTRPIYKMTMPSLLELPGVGTMKELDAELVGSLEPDLVILPKKLISYVETLEALDIKVLVVNPETTENVNEMLTLISKTCCDDQTKLNTLLKFREEKQTYENQGEKPTVLLLGNGDKLTAAPKNMYQNDLIEMAGGINANGNSEETYWESLSYEKMLELNPEYIVIPSGASYTKDDITSDPVLKDLDAVKNNKILSMPGIFEEWDSPIPSSVLGVLWLRSKLHSDLYSSESFRKDLVDYYETFYGFTPSEEAISSAL